MLRKTSHVYFVQWLVGFLHCKGQVSSFTQPRKVFIHHPQSQIARVRTRHCGLIKDNSCVFIGISCNRTCAPLAYSHTWCHLQRQCCFLDQKNGISTVFAYDSHLLFFYCALLLFLSHCSSSQVSITVYSLWRKGKVTHFYHC